ncbi:P-loop containing nucleoside triphosphate hydrolase protein [Auriculariales sp. MPI-PUGE-AT-0066]|nr:P-loop containing nucleoside triphosphate hydrolase protein [Auriculariales sp. MPI-PUGE-AT-0066]
MDLEQERAFLAPRCPSNVEHDDHSMNQGLATTPLFTASALQTAGAAVFPLRGLLGATSDGDLVYFNTNSPSSGVVCGVQGSGKSHTVSCLLENALVKDPRTGNLPQPLAALVFHFDEQGGDRPCEAAYLGSPAAGSDTHVKRIVVLASYVNMANRHRTYAHLHNVDVQPLLLGDADITAPRLLALMGLSDDAMENLPLYMHTILQIVREIGPENFSYEEFKRRIKQEKFDPKQQMMLTQRLRLLDGFVQPLSRPIRSYFSPGDMIIVDLTDPFLNGEFASLLFDIVLSSFMGWNCPTGKIVVLDEAHKYLTNKNSSRLNRSIATIIRQQRHLATRVIVASQEPTVIPDTLLDLSSFVVCHRFTSPSWCSHLSRHVSTQDQSWLQDVMNLPTGDAIVFSPAARTTETLAPLGTEALRIRIRPRLTSDGGASVMAIKSATQLPLEEVTAAPTSGWVARPISLDPQPAASVVSADSTPASTSGQNSSYPPLEAYLSRIQPIGEYKSEHLPKIRGVVQFLHEQWVSSGKREALVLGGSELERSVSHIKGRLTSAATAAQAMGLASLSGSGKALALQLAAVPTPSAIDPAAANKPPAASAATVADPTPASTSGQTPSYPPLEAYLSRIQPVGEYKSEHLPKIRGVVQFLYEQWVSSGKREAFVLGRSELGRSVKHLDGKLMFAATAAQAMGLALLSGNGHNLALQLAAVPPSKPLDSPAVVIGSGPEPLSAEALASSISRLELGETGSLARPPAPTTAGHYDIPSPRQASPHDTSLDENSAESMEAGSSSGTANAFVTGTNASDKATSVHTLPSGALPARFPIPPIPSPGATYASNLPTGISLLVESGPVDQLAPLEDYLEQIELLPSLLLSLPPQIRATVKGYVIRLITELHKQALRELNRNFIHSIVLLQSYPVAQNQSKWPSTLHRRLVS